MGQSASIPRWASQRGLRQHDPADQQRNGGSVGPVHADVNRNYAARCEIDCYRQPRSSKSLARPTIDNKNVRLSVIHLHDVERMRSTECAGHLDRIRGVGKQGKRRPSTV